jgi:myo-inositol-1(or 4)-monophosphatase
LQDLLRAACFAALRAGEIVRERFGKPHQIRMKGTIDLVTEADLASEQAIVAYLRQYSPAPILAEESNPASSAYTGGPLWIIDPLDGTTNFAHGFPYFGISIAYSVDHVSQVGAIYCPLQDELFCAGRGGGAWLNGQPIRVSTQHSLIESLVATGFPYAIRENLAEVLGQLGKVLPRVRDLRRAGAAAVDLAYLACGRLDGFWELDLKPWDTAAGQLLIEEAGGRVSSLAGGLWNPWQNEILASNGRIHGQLSELLSSPTSD